MQARMPAAFKPGPAKNRKRIIFLTCHLPIKERQACLRVSQRTAFGLVGKLRLVKRLQIKKLHRLDVLGEVWQKARRIFVARSDGPQFRQATGMRLCNQFSSWAGWHAVAARAVATCESRHSTDRGGRDSSAGLPAQPSPAQ